MIVFLTGVSGHADYGTHVVPAMIILGVGFGMSFVPVTIAGTNGVAPADSGRIMAAAFAGLDSPIEATLVRFPGRGRSRTAPAPGRSEPS